jgi:hypothetical protein
MQFAQSVARKNGGDMPITVTRAEAQKIIKNKADAITRWYRNGNCQYKAGQKETLYLEDEGKMIPVAYVTIKTLRPCSLDSRGAGNLAEELANGEGFGHPSSWERNLRSIYGEVLDNDTDKQMLTRIRFDVDKLAKG